MTGHSAACREDALSRVHSTDVLGAGLDANKYDLLADGLGLLGMIRRKYDLADSGAR